MCGHWRCSAISRTDRRSRERRHRDRGFQRVCRRLRSDARQDVQPGQRRQREFRRLDGAHAQRSRGVCAERASYCDHSATSMKEWCVLVISTRLRFRIAVLLAALAALFSAASADAATYKLPPTGQDQWYWEISPPSPGLAGLPATTGAYPAPGSANIWDTDLFQDSNRRGSRRVRRRSSSASRLRQVQHLLRRGRRLPRRFPRQLRLRRR